MKCVIVHYRVGRTDGVSLEIAKRKAALEAEGHVVRLVSGPVCRGSDFIIPELEFDLSAIRQIKENSFSYFNRCDWSEEELLQRIDSVSLSIQKSFLDYCSHENFDCIFLHNIFSHGRHIAAASALFRVAKILKVPVVATHHDFYWERPEYLHTAHASIDEYLRKYLPPVADNIRHICINSLAAKELERRSGVKASVQGDVFDFDQPQWVEDEFNSDLLDAAGVENGDIVVLQATRIVERKAIEVAVQLMEGLQKQIGELAGRTLYNGKKVTPQSKFVLLIAGYAEDSSRGYLHKLKKYIKRRNVGVRFIGDIVAACRSNKPKKIYSLADVYAVSDFITYPSTYEGWGNQFLEAVYAKRPIAVFEYPVFRADIKQEGYSFISLGYEVDHYTADGLVELPDMTIERAALEIVDALLSKKTRVKLEENFSIAKKYHSLQSFYRLCDW